MSFMSAYEKMEGGEYWKAFLLLLVGVHQFHTSNRWHSGALISSIDPIAVLSVLSITWEWLTPLFICVFTTKTF